MKITVPADLTHNVEEVENFLVKHTGTKFDESNKCWVVLSDEVFFHQVVYEVLIKRLNQKVKIPSYKTIGSSGVDLEAFLENPIEIGPNKSALIPTGLAIAIPEDTEVQIRPRSGLAAKSSIGVLNSPGTIDSDYRGEIKIILFNHGNEKFLVNNGDRIAQMVLMPVLKFEFEETKDLPDTLRGSGGFGSTGKK